MKVIGAGYGRTGTKSLKAALEKLGIGPCYHMEELLRNPKDVKHWQNAYDGSQTKWDQLFKNYNSIVDFPGSLYYKELATHFPKSKVILSVRNPEKWYKSVRSTIYGFNPGLALKIKMLFSMPFSAQARNLFRVVQLNQKSIWQRNFEGKFEDKEFAIQKFNNHIAEVKNTIPPERLLIFEAKDGWEPLCNFLNRPIPEEPYPRSNTREDFHNWAKGVMQETLK